MVWDIYLLGRAGFMILGILIACGGSVIVEQTLDLKTGFFRHFAFAGGLMIIVAGGFIVFKASGIA